MKHRIHLLLTVLQVATAAPAAEEFAPAELLVGFQPGTRGVRADSIRNSLGANKIKAWPEIWAEHWNLPPGLSIPQAVQALSANPNVVYAEPNYLARAVDVPNDPRRGEQWALHNLAQSIGVVDADIDAPEAWSMLHDASSIVVGIVDSGMDYRHQDLAANVFRNPGESGTDAQGREKASNGIDDDGNGYIDDVQGWNFVNNTNDPMDDYHHGTHVAGTIGAVGNNGIGIAGVAWSVKLLPLKFLNASGSGSISGATDAVLYAAKLGVRITSHSWVTGAKSKTLESAIKNSGALVIAAAGNNSTNTVLYPAAYSLANVISVAATDSNDDLASFSNFGDWVQLAAPGVNALSTLPNDNYGFNSGTSMATPHVSGVAALVMAQNPGLTIAGIKAQILNNVDVLSGLVGKVTTGGRLNARKALGAPELPPDTTPPAAVTDLGAVALSPDSIALTWTTPGDDGLTGMAFVYDLRYSLNPIITEADFIAAPQVQPEPGPKGAGEPEALTIAGLAGNRTYYFALKTVDEAGNASPASNVATTTTPQAEWNYLRLSAGQNLASHMGSGVTSLGAWAIAYDDASAGVLKCAVHQAGTGYYNVETVTNGGAGAALSYNSSEDEISVSHVYGTQLWLATRGAFLGGTWTSTQIEAKDVHPNETSIGFIGNNPVISYYKTTRRATGLYVAQRTGSTWSIRLIDSSAYAVYNQLAIDPSGNPAIAYSADANKDGNVDTLKFARFNGTAWTTSVVEGGGAYGTLAFDPSTGQAAIAHWNPANGQLRFLRSSGSGWLPAEIVETGPAITGCSLTFTSDGTAYLAYGSTHMRLAIRDLSGNWTFREIDTTTRGSTRNSLKGRPGLTPGTVAYRGPTDGYNPMTARFAIRQIPY